MMENKYVKSFSEWLNESFDITDSDFELCFDKLRSIVNKKWELESVGRIRKPSDTFFLEKFDEKDAELLKKAGVKFSKKKKYQDSHQKFEREGIYVRFDDIWKHVQRGEKLGKNTGLL